MSDDKLEQLLRSYLDLGQHAEGSSEELAHSKALQIVADMLESDANSACRLVATALRIRLSREEEDYLAASAVEDLVDAHGPAVVDQLLAWSDGSERMGRMLASVYHYDFDPNVFRRINEMLQDRGLTPWTGSVGGERPLRSPRRTE